MAEQMYEDPDPLGPMRKLGHSPEYDEIFHECLRSLEDNFEEGTALDWLLRTFKVTGSFWPEDEDIGWFKFRIAANYYDWK